MPRFSKQGVGRFELAEKIYGDFDRQDFRRQYEPRWDLDDADGQDGTTEPMCDNCATGLHKNADLGCTKCDPRARRAGMPGPVPISQNQTD